MATKKETETKKTQIIDDGTEEIFIPLDYTNPDNDTVYVAVNGKAIILPRGENVRVKKEYAELIKQAAAERDAQFRAMEARRTAEGYINTSM